MTVKDRLYPYENRRYVSPRQLRERYGIANLTVLQNKYLNRFQMSGAALLDQCFTVAALKGDRRLCLFRIGVSCVADQRAGINNKPRSLQELFHPPATRQRIRQRMIRNCRRHRGGRP